MKLNQFAVYRVDQQTAGKALWHLPYQEARQQNVSITVENYRLISIHEMQENEKVADIWKRTKNQCEVSDVLVLNKNGEISCYYVDENYPQYLAGFIRINTSGALITMETENYQIDGKKGNWIATDTVIIDGKQFYLMEHQVYRDQAQGVILDAYGKMVVEECKKFDEKTKQKIHDYIQQQVPLNPVEQLKQDGKIRLEHYQKFYQNGTYERSRESGTEANYDMVDGLVNNQKKNLEKISDARNNKQTSRNQQNNKPKKRRSVIKRLHQKQIAIARRSGKPIPKYLDQGMWDQNDHAPHDCCIAKDHKSHDHTGFSYPRRSSCPIVITEDRRSALVHGVDRCLYQLADTGNNGHDRNVDISAGDRQHVVTTESYQAVGQLHDKSGSAQTGDIFGIAYTFPVFLFVEQAHAQFRFFHQKIQNKDSGQAL